MGWACVALAQQGLLAFQTGLDTLFPPSHNTREMWPKVLETERWQGPLSFPDRVGPMQSSKSRADEMISLFIY